MIQWGLGQGNGFQNALATGMHMGQQARQAQQQNALLEVRRKELEQRQAQEQKAEKRADLPMLSRLLDSVQDEASFHRARTVAQEYGIDISSVPPAYDPAWVEQTRTTMKMLQSPEAQKALSTAGQIAVDMGLKPGTPEFSAKVTELWTAEQARIVATPPGGGAATVNPVTGQASFVIVPNDGSQPTGAPAAGAIPPPPPGFQIDGGQTGAPSATFSAGFRGLSGEQVTSTKRSPARNRAVGGVSNSYHLTGQARDSVPPPGMSMAAYAAQLRRLNPDMDVINEGDHVHMEPRG